tara:strand:+ start:236 stop:559 length:324 start_codon:yes stop_codon:yes gene_type:complete
MNTDADSRFLKERLEASKNVVTDCGFELVEFARSITTGEILIFMRGASDDVITVCQVMDQTGANDSLTTETLETYDRFAANQPRVAEVSKRFAPADQDEINRMLLDQ